MSQSSAEETDVETNTVERVVPLVAHRMNMTAFPSHLVEPESEVNDHVPGFAVTGWLVRYPVERWGSAWIEHGSMEVRYRRPLHVGDQLTIRVRELSPAGSERSVQVFSPSAQSTSERNPDAHGPLGRIELVIVDNQEIVVASGWAEAPDEARTIVEVEPSNAPDPFLRPHASALQGQPLGTLFTTFEAHRDLPFVGLLGLDDPWLGRTDAHPVVLVWIANLVVRDAIGFSLGQWKHTGTQSDHYRSIPDGSSLRFSGRVANTFRAGAHEFFVAEVLVEADGQASVLLRLTYLCEPEPS